ncbi:MAG: hypothetical protein HC904_04440 [Blastochloris sp.]|nr:hypothetical protein [Blastochloris sp.]
MNEKALVGQYKIASSHKYKKGSITILEDRTIIFENVHIPDLSSIRAYSGVGSWQIRSSGTSAVKLEISLTEPSYSFQILLLGKSPPYRLSVEYEPGTLNKFIFEKAIKQ